MKNWIFYLGLTVVSAFLCSCASPGFERDWQRAVSAYEEGKYATPEGPWIGEWNTATNGHTGDLRCLVKEHGSDPGEYEFRYHATWAKILSGTYRVNYPVKKANDGHVVVEGTQDLGMFGSFEHKGEIAGKRFTASYSNDKGDLGKFEMKRPKPAE